MYEAAQGLQFAHLEEEKPSRADEGCQGEVREGHSRSGSSPFAAKIGCLKQSSQDGPPHKGQQSHEDEAAIRTQKVKTVQVMVRVGRAIRLMRSSMIRRMTVAFFPWHARKTRTVQALNFILW